MPHSSSSSHDTTASSTTENTSSRPLVTNMSRPVCTSSASESMSEVMRDTTMPAFSRS